MRSPRLSGLNIPEGHMADLFASLFIVGGFAVIGAVVGALAKV
jgi:hypothetical protein